MTTMIEKMGGNVMCSSSRESIMYQSLVFNKDVEAALAILADTVLHPALLPEELAAQQEATRWEIGEIWNKPEMILPEVLHTVAFQDNTLGNPLLCPVESLEVMKVRHLRDFMHAWYTPERIVVAGAGMPHERMVELAAKWFGGLSASGASGASAASTDASAASTNARNNRDTRDTRDTLADTRARYTGGELYESTPTMEFTQVYVAFEGLSIHDDDIYALATMQILLGGGGSFSAGGPGKGMYSRLYSNVLNQHHAVDFCAAFHHCYKDSGLFGIAASVKPDFNGHIANIIARELDSLTSPHVRGAVTKVELARAKNQLKSSLVMSLESRLVEVEDLGRQVQVHGHKVSVEEMCEKIDAVDLDALHRVANRVLRARRSGEKNNLGLGSGQSTVVAQGNLDGLGDVRRTLANRGLGAAVA
ncbi:mitochondrial processing peptidase [Ceraceosorus bombacis]|uniref:Alpha-MPP n=1 Tax=Ceraceosorus bombacis TaxID=401625 RepID=A0A0N7L8V0_9BASI|nr:mitochondrial processing peptidase [Ceraceosorus bombacis]